MNETDFLKFGVEIELKSLDGRDPSISPLQRGEPPFGISKIAELISSSGLKSEVRNWGHNHDNDIWICKPDSSCGIEVCSPVFENGDTKQIRQVMDVLGAEPDVKVDEKCSFHVHIGLKNSDLSCFASVLSWWVKCEHLFVDAFPKHRKRNKYCRFIGKTSLINDSELVSPQIIINKLSDKYLTANSFHLFNRNRNSVEFRLCEGIKDSNTALNWIGVVSHFVKKSIAAGLPEDYRWLEAGEIFDFLDFESSSRIDLKKWLVGRLLKNIDFSDGLRVHVFKKYAEIYSSTFGQTPSFIVGPRDK